MSTNLIATCKFHMVTCGREEAIAKSWLDEQEQNIRRNRWASWLKVVKTPKTTVNPKRKFCK
ncbi:hypothetical protein NC01_01160 [Streptococcus uberis]|nr:hypothetical protein NC01_01160 [Streptococcus uberis]